MNDGSTQREPTGSKRPAAEQFTTAKAMIDKKRRIRAGGEDDASE